MIGKLLKPVSAYNNVYRASKPLIGSLVCLPFCISEADDAPPVGHSMRHVYESSPGLVLVRRDLAEGLHCCHQAMQNTAAFWVLVRIGRPYSCQGRH